MHKYNAHAATDVTGFGLLGHAQNLASNQKNEVSLVIHNLPVIAKMAAVAKLFGNLFHLLQVCLIFTVVNINWSQKFNKYLNSNSLL